MYKDQTSSGAKQNKGAVKVSPEKAPIGAKPDSSGKTPPSGPPKPGSDSGKPGTKI